MIRSTFILHILDLLLDGDPQRRAVRPQIDYVTDSEYEYTGAGVLATFQRSIGIEKFKVGEGRLVLDGVRINSPEIGSMGADTILFLKDGIIDFLEIHTYDGNIPVGNLTIMCSNKFLRLVQAEKWLIRNDPVNFNLVDGILQ